MYYKLSIKWNIEWNVSYRSQEISLLFLVTSGNKDCLLFLRAIYMGKLVSSEFGQMVSKIQDQ